METASKNVKNLKNSLEKYGLGFSNAVAITIDTTNVMKGEVSGVQRHIRNYNPSLYEVGCICHLPNLWFV